MDVQQLSTKSYKQLKEWCVAEGLSTVGTKHLLAARLAKHLQSLPASQRETKSAANHGLRKRSQTLSISSRPLPAKEFPMNHVGSPQLTSNPLHPTNYLGAYSSASKSKSKPKPQSLSSSSSTPSRSPSESHPVRRPKDKPLPSRPAASCHGVAIQKNKLYWTPIHDDALCGTIWEKLSNDRVIEIDAKDFELQFQIRSKKSKPSSSRQSMMYSMSMDRSKRIMSRKRSQRIASVLDALDLSHIQIRGALLEMDEVTLPANKLSNLMSIIPNVREQRLWETIPDSKTSQNAKGDGVELFFHSMHDFHALRDRLKMWMFKRNFHELCDSMMSQYNAIQRACNTISNHHALHLLLRIVLALGNHLNSTLTRSPTRGFDISILSKMQDILSCDGTRSLIMYLYDFCDKKHPEAIATLTEWVDILKMAQTVDMNLVAMQYQRMLDEVQEIGRLVHSEEIEKYAVNDRFIASMTAFHNEATSKLTQCKKQMDDVMRNAHRVMQCFNFGSKSNRKPIASFIKIWWQFVTELASSKEKLVELEKQRQHRMAKRKQQRRSTSHLGQSENARRILHVQSLPVVDRQKNDGNKSSDDNDNGKKYQFQRDSVLYDDDEDIDSDEDDDDDDDDDSDIDLTPRAVPVEPTLLRRKSTVDEALEKRTEFKMLKAEIGGKLEPIHQHQSSKSRHSHSTISNKVYQKENIAPNAPHHTERGGHHITNGDARNVHHPNSHSRPSVHDPPQRLSRIHKVDRPQLQMSQSVQSPRRNHGPPHRPKPKSKSKAKPEPFTLPHIETTYSVQTMHGQQPHTFTHSQYHHNPHPHHHHHHQQQQFQSQHNHRPQSATSSRRRSSRKRRSMTTTEYERLNRAPSPIHTEESRQRRYESLGFSDPKTHSFPPPPPKEPVPSLPAMTHSVSLTPAPRHNPYVHSNLQSNHPPNGGGHHHHGYDHKRLSGVLRLQRNVSHDTAHRQHQGRSHVHHYFAHPLQQRPLPKGQQHRLSLRGQQPMGQMTHSASLHGVTHSATNHHERLSLHVAGSTNCNFVSPQNPLSPLFITQSSSDSVFAEIEDAGDWKTKYKTLKAQHDRLQGTQQRNRELQQTVDRLVQRERERERERQRSSGGNVPFKQKLVAINKELSGFNEEFYADKLEEILVDDEADPLMIGYEVKRLQSTSGAFSLTLKGIIAFIERKSAPDVMHYDEWDMNEVIAWIKTLDGGRYIPYCNVLRAFLVNEGVFGGGSLMLMDDPDDLKEEPWCIQSEADRIGLIQHFQSLPALKSQMTKVQ